LASNSGGIRSTTGASGTLPRMALAWPSIVFGTAILLLGAIRLCEAHWYFAQSPGMDWNSSEWMIDYAAGFVRRGLDGAMLARLMRITGLGFFTLWASITTAVYLGVCWHLLRQVNRLGGSAIWRFLLLLNPALVAFAVECAPDGSFLRKDVLFVAATALLVCLGERTLHSAQPTARNMLPLLAAACALSTALALTHEGIFLFGWLPLNFALLLAVLSRLRIHRLTSWLLALSAFLPALVATAASIHWHGDARTAQIICQSWHGLSVPTVCKAGGQFPPAVDGLAWSFSYALSLPLSVASRFPFFIVLVVFCGSIEIAAIHRLIPSARLDHLLALLALPLLASIPLYLLGWDWGRFLFTVTGQQVWVLLSDTMRPAVFDVLPKGLRRLATRAAGTRLTERLDAFMHRTLYAPPILCLILLILPVPPVPQRNPMLYSSPPVIVIQFARQLIAHYHV